MYNRYASKKETENSTRSICHGCIAIAFINLFSKFLCLEINYGNGFIIICLVGEYFLFFSLKNGNYLIKMLTNASQLQLAASVLCQCKFYYKIGRNIKYSLTSAR